MISLIDFGQTPVTRPTKEMDREPNRQSETEKRESPAQSPTVNPSNQPKASNPPNQANGNSFSIQTKINKPPSQTNGNNLLKQPTGKILPSQANGNQSSASVHTTITTFHTTPTLTDQKVVQVIHQPSRQPRGSAAQLLHQMYTVQQQQKQQQHGSLHAAAQQQQHQQQQLQQQKRQSHLPAAQQVRLFGDKMPSLSSPTSEGSPVSSPQQSPKPVTSPSSPGSTHMVRASQSPIPVTANQRIAPHALLLGKSACTSPAQMLLRAQMQLILTSTVRPELPVLSSPSSRFSSSQLQSLTLRPPPPGTLTIPPNLPLKASATIPPSAAPRPRAPIAPLRLSQTPTGLGREASKVGDGCPTSPQAGAKTPPVRHLTVPPPSLYSPVQSHALAKHKASSPGSLKRSHSQTSQQPASLQNHTSPSSPQGPTPKKPLPVLYRCPSAPGMSTQATSSFLPSSPSVTTERSQTTTTTNATSPTLALPLGSTTPTSERSLLASKQLLKIALSSASVQMASNPSKMAAITTSRDYIQSKPLSPMFSRPIKLDCQGHSPQRSLGQPLNQLSPVSTQISPVPTTTPKIPSPLPSPQRPCPPSPILPPGLLPSGAQKHPKSPVALHHPTAPTERLPKEQKKVTEVEGRRTDPVVERLMPLAQPLKTTILVKPPTLTTNSQTLNATPAGKALDFTLSEPPCSGESQGKAPIKNIQKSPQPPTASPPALPVHPGDHCEDVSTQSDNHSAVSSLSSDLSPTQPSVVPPLNDPLVPSASPSPLTPLLGQNPSPSPSSGSTTTPENQEKPEATKPVILTHLVDGFIIQEGLQPFPVIRSSLMVDQSGRKLESAMNGLKDPEPFHCMEPADNSSDTDADVGPHDNGYEDGQRVMVQCEFCRRETPSPSFVRSKRFCSSSCARRFSHNKRFRPARRSGSQDGQHSPGLKPTESTYEAQPGATEQWRVQPPRGDEEEAAAPMKTRLRRHTELERERETRDASEEARSEPCSPQDPAASPDQSSRPRPAEWTVDQVWEFISALPGCQEIAESFRAQEIDGQALLLLTEDHLMTAMNVKLGPALKICARINSLKEH
ncbi:polyhomeotic-like protein 3 isoform X1 [Alosa alosa]|uniref:polyhomeotic-like protein 3 isoform X1 n=1 Tax=Alosa alosa TaxID=278164 RepID=UPI0020151C80|nr:polyhomeotic-like protein 3 isoform X1 [Alosa alosa]